MYAGSSPNSGAEEAPDERGEYVDDDVEYYIDS